VNPAAATSASRVQTRKMKIEKPTGGREEKKEEKKKKKKEEERRRR
jgi:ribosomal protein L12E/L44/L45/RPP1/RPP2